MNESRSIRNQAQAGVGQQQTSRFLGFSCLLVVMLALVGASGAAAAGTANKASLKVAVPANAAQATTVTVTLSGQAGKYNAVAVYNYGIACPAKVPTTYNSKAVKRSHRFKVTLSIESANAGAHRACVYLYNSAHPTEATSTGAGPSRSPSG
jgi:hypothetical protein